MDWVLTTKFAPGDKVWVVVGANWVECSECKKPRQTAWEVVRAVVVNPEPLRVCFYGDGHVGASGDDLFGQAYAVQLHDGSRKRYGERNIYRTKTTCEKAIRENHA